MSELWNGDWIVFSICVVDSCCTTFSPMQVMVAVVYNRLNFFWHKGNVYWALVSLDLLLHFSLFVVWVFLC